MEFEATEMEIWQEGWSHPLETLLAEK